MSQRAKAGALLELREEGPDGPRYYLGGRGIHAGDRLEMQLAAGSWQRVRFEWSAIAGTLPRLFFPADERGLPLPEQARFRWPPEEGARTHRVRRQEPGEER